MIAGRGHRAVELIGPGTIESFEIERDIAIGQGHQPQLTADFRHRRHARQRRAEFEFVDAQIGERHAQRQHVAVALR